ncbi:hypothetical protein KNSL1_002905 [Colletotrichum chrysophilum]|nr:hypothetical protein KNSL1_002905 [Colletotrichum chrysophilum]
MTDVYTPRIRLDYAAFFGADAPAAADAADWVRSRGRRAGRDDGDTAPSRGHRCGAAAAFDFVLVGEARDVQGYGECHGQLG